ncbi:YciE/YciF ferroxidase family protein [Mucilaginibacter xinganensis]|uniref:Uncharacterized protein n=1 Tax=Mucilaginibacter xinganensis TaxID=1234841 RepID=A0A223NUR1_9SPHI|nr:DUF892 family protein [Mucilaginibacter xinganensis]ASU33597.1 hypothetical protein MuYL_1701 [Mucilaginibacter xinganensis]
MENSPIISCLRKLLHEDVSRFISAELQLKNSLPALIAKENSVQLKMVLHEYLAMTDKHIKQLETFCREENIRSYSLSNRIMKAYIEEANEKLSGCTCREVKDACLLAAIQGINHFKISTYGTSAAFADALRLDKAAALFHQAQLDEKNIDERLTYLAEHDINFRAKSPITSSQ